MSRRAAALIALASVLAPHPAEGQTPPPPLSGDSLSFESVRAVEVSATDPLDRLRGRVGTCLDRSGDEAQLRCLRAVESRARALSRLDPHGAGAWYWLAATRGMQADREGGRARIRLASGAYEAAQRALELDPEHPGAHHVMGRVAAAVMRLNTATRLLVIHLLGGEALSGATWAEAERLLSFAERHAPDVADHHYELAALYRDTDRWEEARREAAHVFEDRVTTTSASVRSKARRLLAEVP